MKKPRRNVRWMIVGAICTWCGIAALELYKRWPNAWLLWAVFTIGVILTAVYIADAEEK